MRNGWFESEAERKAFYAKQDAFWNRPNDEVLADLVMPGTWKPVARNVSVTVKPSAPAYTGNVISMAEWRATHWRPKRCSRLI